MNALTKIATSLFAVALSIAPLTGLNAASTGTITLKAEIDRSVLPAESKQNALVRISLLAPENSSDRIARKHRVNLSVVLDKSGSMGSQQKMEKAKEAAVAALRMLKPDDVFSLIVYDTSAKTLVPASPVSDYNGIEAIIRSISADGNTALFAGVALGAGEIRKNLREGFVNRIVLLSDGQANVGPSSPGELGRLGAALMKEGISVSTVGVGSDYNEDLMTSLSQNSDGNFYFVENSNDLPMIFAKELGSALKVAAQNIDIRIICPDGIKAQGILGQECKINGNSIDISFNQVYGGHEKSLILQLEVPPSEAEKILKLATVEMTYKDIGGSIYTVKENVSASFSKDPEKIKKSSNEKVLDEVAIKQNLILRQEAVKAADEGKMEQAKGLFKKGADLLKTRAQESSSPTVKEEAKNADATAADIQDAKELDSNKRKEIQGENYQKMNSQPYQQRK